MNNGGQVFNRVTGTLIENVELSPRKAEDVHPYMFRPNAVLLDTRDRIAVGEALTAANFVLDDSQDLREPPAADEAGAKPGEVRRQQIERSVRNVLPALGLERWVRQPGVVEGQVSVPDLVADLRKVEVSRDGASADDAFVPKTAQIWPVYVAHGEPDGEFGPATAAEPVVPDVGPAPTGNAGRGVRIGVVDTGAFLPHQWLHQRAHSRGPEDDEILDDNLNGIRDFEASHGSFVAGVILRHAPAATIIARAAIDSQGIVEDPAVAAAIESLRNENLDILNLSLGGYGDPEDPVPFAATFRAIELLRQGNPNLVVVAAAGNFGEPQPFFPAAWDSVIGVGALGSDMRPAKFSNFGPWVNAWANGVKVRSCFDLDHTSVTAGAIWSGTSFATPRVTGAIAAAMSPA
jgi:subtilisin family serine protease